MTYPVYSSESTFMGYWDEDKLRPLIVKREARVLRKKKSDGRIDVRVVLSSVATDRVRLINSGRTRPALQTCQVEDLFKVMRAYGPVSVTGRLRTLMLAVGDHFVPWGEDDVFPANRWNPD